MNTVLASLPLIAGVAVLALLVISIVQLWIRYEHPVRIFLRTLSAASIIGILGLAGILPASMWWGPWLLSLVTVTGAVVACRRALVSSPPAEPTARQAKNLRPPSRLNLAGEVIVYLAVVAVALYAG
ncbi:hypothetical protein ACFQS2_02005 [Brachybacterium sp. GCM10030267]|uniref:hypothetical protein n=1 Tax=Brachybacterium sp. GCM10030267 TaxID=3273381 RepID=UPI0036216424